MATFTPIELSIQTAEYGAIKTPYFTPADALENTHVIWTQNTYYHTYHWEWGSTVAGGGLSNFEIVNATSPMWVYRQGVLNPDFAGLTSAEKRFITLSNGNYININNVSGIQLIYHNADGDTLGSTPITNAGQGGWSGAVLYKDDNSGDIIVGCVVINTNSSSAFGPATNQSLPQETTNAYYHFFDNAEPLVWEAWEMIKGNSGQYAALLTMIKEESVGTLTSWHFGTSADFDRISAQSSIWNTYRNMEYGVEKVIAWSGNGWMTLTLSDPQTTPRACRFTFKFYRTEISATTPFYSDYFDVTVDGDTRGIDMYLSFVTENSKAYGAFIPVVKKADGTYMWGGLIAHSESELGYMFMWLAASGSPEANSPYDTGTTDNGGNPNPTTPQSHIDVPTAPTLDATLSGMFTIYCPDDTELAKISQFLWSDNVIDNIKKYFNNFSDNIMAFYVLPCKPANNPVKKFKVGNMESDDADLASVEYIDHRFFEIDMGSVTIKPHWDSYLDYSPYSSIQICLPGIGCQSIDIDDVMCPSLADGSLSIPEETTIHLDYTIDLMTGVLAAFVSINGEMRYQFPGKIGYSIPLTGDNYVRMAQGFVTAAAGLIGTVASAGAAAPFTASAAAAGIVNAMKPDVYRGGNLSGDASMMCSQTPYLIYRRPNKPLLEDQVKFTGYPSYKSDTLSEFEGFTTVIDAHVEGISCTEAERAEILNLLKSGVIL